LDLPILGKDVRDVDLVGWHQLIEVGGKQKIQFVKERGMLDKLACSIEGV
jgi:hypothetical protein